MLHALADVTHCLYFMSVSPGLGAGLCYTPSVTVISSYFHKYRVVANGVTLASPGIGIVAVPYLLRWLIEDYGWRFAMSLCGCFMAQVGTLMSLCRSWEPLCHCVGLGNLYVTVSVLGTVMSLCQSWEPLCHCVSLGNRYVTVSVLETRMSLCQSWELLCHCVSLGNRYVTVSVLGGHNHDRLSD